MGADMKTVLGLACLILGCSAKVLFGPVAEANHLNQNGCDVDNGWLAGAAGSNKCYMLIKGYDYSTCYSNDQFGGYGMDWFDAMQCCYYQGGYLAEPQNEEETTSINTYLTHGGWGGLTSTTRVAGSGCLEPPGAMKTGTRENQTRMGTKTVQLLTVRQAIGGWTLSVTLLIMECPTMLSVRRRYSEL